MDDDISGELASFVYALAYLLAFFIPLSNASLEAKVSFGFWMLLVGVVIKFMSSGLGETISEGGINIIVGVIEGLAIGVIFQAVFPLVPAPLNGLIFITFLMPSILGFISIAQKLSRL